MGESSKLQSYRLYGDHEPIVEKELLHKVLSNGAYATFALVRHQGEYKAMLYLNGKRVNGPALPQPLDAPVEEVAYWMGNKPGVGLTHDEAQMITQAVTERRDRVGE